MKGKRDYSVMTQSLVHPSNIETLDATFPKEEMFATKAHRKDGPSMTPSTNKEERRQARTAAVFYSECFLRGIEPMVADTAAEDAKQAYDRWWVKALQPSEPDAAGVNKGSEAENGTQGLGSRKRRRTDAADPSGVMAGSGITMKAAKGGAGDNDHRWDGTAHHQLCVTQTEHQDALWDQYGGAQCPIGHQPHSIDRQHMIYDIKQTLVNRLKSTGGSTEDLEFRSCMDRLLALQDTTAIVSSNATHGNWLTLSKPTYEDCKGTNEKGEAMYTLGRIAFDMFRPNHLMCSLKAVFNRIENIDPRNPGRPLNVPRSLHKEIKGGNVQMLCYDIMVAFTIKADQTKRGVHRDDAAEGEYIVPRSIDGILTNQGYAIPDPSHSNRLSIWFSGGSLEVMDEENDLEEWRNIFDTGNAPNRNFKEYANVLAARFLLGAHLPECMESDGSLSFALKRPIGGHGSAYCDVTYLDDDFRIMKGHRGSIFVSTRIPDAIH